MWRIRRPPKNLCLLLTHQRSGSTWLLDICRSLPCFRLQPTFDIFGLLGLRGRRYPADLSRRRTVSASGETAIEVTPFCWETIPEFAQWPEREHPAAPVLSVEKAHPHFADPHWNRFKMRLLQASHQDRLKIVLLVREPHDAIDSFLKYQRRKKNWYSHVPQEKVFRFFFTEYERLSEIKSLLKCHTVEFQQLKENYFDTINNIIAYCYPENTWNSSEMEDNAIHIQNLTNFNARGDNKSIFFENSKYPNNSNNNSNIILSRYDLNRLYDIYESIKNNNIQFFSTL